MIQLSYMKKTLIVTLEFPPTVGGIATYVDQLASGLDPEKTVVWAPPQQQSETFDSTRNYKIIRKPLLFPSFIWPRWLLTCVRLWRICKKENIELIMIHHVLPVGYAAWFVKKVTKIPYIIFSHGTDIVAATRTRWKKRMVRVVGFDALQVIANSDSLMRRVLLPFPELADRTSVVYPCPEEGLYEPSVAQEMEELRDKLALQGKKVILSIARISEGKGFPHLVSVMSDVVKRNPNIVWIIIGDGHKREELLSEIQKNNLQNIVRYLGQVPHQELKLFYNVADIFCLLTHPDQGFEEGLGLVFLEAAAAGLPAIAGRSGGVEEAVVHMQTGIVVDTYHHQQAIDAILTLTENEAFAKRLGQEGQHRVRANFNWKHQLERLNQWIN